MEHCMVDGKPSDCGRILADLISIRRYPDVSGRAYLPLLFAGLCYTGRRGSLKLRKSGVQKSFEK